MISILIPIYNTAVVQLVQALLTQCNRARITFEIICLDDQSDAKYLEMNKSLSSLTAVNYIKLNANLGRSKIRNRLAGMARFDHLLFLDSDSEIVSMRYIKKYLDAISCYPTSILNGGTSYSEKAPKDSTYLLHWLYASKRESPKAKMRNKRPVELFHSNNFVVPRGALQAVPFDRSITSYGYEDIHWAYQINDHHTIYHIDNPIKHIGLKKHELFLSQIEVSTQNLINLYTQDANISTRLIRTYQFLLQLGLTRIFHNLFEPHHDRILSKLKSTNPKLFHLDLLKLYYFTKGMIIDRL